MKPARTLHKIRLFKEEKLLPGKFFALDEDGRGRLLDKKWFWDCAQPASFPPVDEFVAHVFGFDRPGHGFTSKPLGSQEAASESLKFHALRLLSDKKNRVSPKIHRRH